MAIKTRFFAGVYYGQDDFKKMIKDGLSSGYVIGEGGQLAVTADGSALQVTVATGRAYLNGYSVDVQDSAETLEVQASPGSQRLDRVVFHLDEDSGITLIIKKGTASAPPVLTRSGKIYEISLARVRVRAGAGNIQQSDITDERNDASVCGAAGAAGVASINRLGRVKVDTTNGLTISGDGTLGHDGFSRAMKIYARQWGDQHTVVGYVDTDGCNWETPTGYTTWGTYSGLKISLPTRADYHLFGGFSRNPEAINQDWVVYVRVRIGTYNQSPQRPGTPQQLYVNVNRGATSGPLLYQYLYDHLANGDWSWGNNNDVLNIDDWLRVHIPADWSDSDTISITITATPNTLARFRVDLVNPAQGQRPVFLQYGPATQ